MKRAEKLYSGKRGLLRILEMATGIQDPVGGQAAMLA